jgi:outer membrane receptor protein involved in Fe transport
MTKSLNLLKSSVAAGALLALCTSALAQEAAETVVVTGTRIQRTEYELPNPVQMVGSDDITGVGSTNVTNYLVRLPSLVSSLSSYDTSGYGTPSSNDGSSLAGLNLLDLRNLGYVRTLVLVDGKRHVSESTGSAAVDVNTIPISLIDRVEVATGGASAIYGADGVSGVVNFIMKRNLEGLHVRTQGAFSEDGGGDIFFGSLAYGYNTDDGRGNISAALEFSQQGRLSYTDRTFTQPGHILRFVPNPDTSTPKPSPQLVPVPDSTYIWSAVTGAISTDFLNTFSPDFTGNGQPYVHGNEYDFYNAIGGSGQPSANVTQGDFLPVQSRKLAQVDGHYDFSDMFKVSAEFKYAKVTSDSRSTPPWDDFLVIMPDNAFLPANVRDAILANGTTAEDGTHLGVFGADYLGLRRRERVTRDTYRTSLDVTGDITPGGGFIKDLIYDVSYVWGQTSVDDGDMGIRVEDRFFAAMDSVIDPSSGKPTCRSNLNPAALPPDTYGLLQGVLGDGPAYSDTSPATYGKLSFTPGPNSGCVPYNPFTPFANQAASLAFMTTDLHTHGVVSQQVLTGTLAGNFPIAEAIFAGPLSVVVGGEYRFEKSSSQGDPNWYPGYTFDNQPESTSGSFDVGEAFAEVSLPVIKNQPFIREFSVDGAVRYSSYSTAGTTTTWKFGGVWAPFDWLRLRGTDAYAVRAPNIGELFAPQQTLYSTVGDPCDKNNVNAGTSYRPANCQALFNALGVPYTPGVTDLSTAGTIKTFVSGNSDLAPESARTLTLGFVVQPIPGLSFSADWYRVVITNAITAPEGQQIADKCVDLSSINNAFCGLVTRDPNAGVPGQITLLTEKQINVASYETAGVDFDLSYRFDPRDFGVEDDYGLFDLHLIGNYLNSLYLTPLQGEKPEYQVAESLESAPKWQMSFDLNWTYGDFDVRYSLDWFSRTLRYTHIVMNAAPDRVSEQYKYYPAKNVSNIQVGYRFAEEYRAYFGLNNLFYQKPGPGSSGYPIDPLGRVFYFGLTIDTKSGLPKLPI